jgi:hypothetical protein
MPCQPELGGDRQLIENNLETLPSPFTFIKSYQPVVPWFGVQRCKPEIVDGLFEPVDRPLEPTSGCESRSGHNGW